MKQTNMDLYRCSAIASGRESKRETNSFSDLLEVGSIAKDGFLYIPRNTVLVLVLVVDVDVVVVGFLGGGGCHLLLR